jgi:hypothetical protein
LLPVEGKGKSYYKGQKTSSSNKTRNGLNGTLETAGGVSQSAIMLDLDTVIPRAWMRDNQEVNILWRLIYKLMRSSGSYFDTLPFRQRDSLIVEFDYCASPQDKKELVSS